jgi:copper resistance protein B
VEATVYAGGASRTAARLKIAHELLPTQRFLLQLEFEMNLCGNADPARDVNAGLSDLEVGLRLRYEVRREIAPYAGVVWAKRRGASGDLLTPPELMLTSFASSSACVFGCRERDLWKS